LKELGNFWCVEGGKKIISHLERGGSFNEDECIGTGFLKKKSGGGSLQNHGGWVRETGGGPGKKKKTAGRNMKGGGRGIKRSP